LQTEFATYHAIKSVDSKKALLYKAENAATDVDCAFICKYGEKTNGCDLFFFENEICYMGKTSQTGEVGVNPVNATIYMTQGKFQKSPPQAILGSEILDIFSVEY
jgi:hypothetical protein